MNYLEVIARVVVIYTACMILLRVSGRREMSDLGPMDFLAMLLLSETVSPAMTGGDNSLLIGLVAAATLMGLCVATEQIAYRSHRAEKLIQGEAVVLVRDGKVDRRVMEKFMITDEDLRATLHKNGLLAVNQVRRAYIEADGEIAVIKQADAA
jgi:uncharacterized membrane protein YcaP (DUF421 family)